MSNSPISAEIPLLTQLSKGSGCGCKLEPALLKALLAGREALPMGNLLLGNHTGDDAAVYELPDGSLLLSTADFFTPLVNDPYQFGRIAAANALSDVYAMGGKPLLAIALMGWPVDVLGTESAGKVLDGARKVCAEAGVPIAGGHTIAISEAVFGLAVQGLVGKSALKRNAGAQAGDALWLTKPLGIGILAAALKRGMLQESDAGYAELIETAGALNCYGAEAGQNEAVHAMTDVTGFGLLGHLVEMCDAGGVSAELWGEKLPMLPAAAAFAAQFVWPDNAFRNWNAFMPYSEGADPFFARLADPQTNGGLLIAAADGVALQGVCIGRILTKKEKTVYVV